MLSTYWKMEIIDKNSLHDGEKAGAAIVLL